MKVNVYNDNSQYIKAILPKEISHNDVKLNDHKTLFQSKKVFILAKMLHYESNDKSKKLEKCLCQIKESGNGIDIGHPFIRYRIFTPYSKNEIRSEIDKFIDGISETDPNKKILLNSRSVLYQSFARFDIGERPGLYRLDLQIIIDNKALGNSLKIDYEIKGNDKLKEAFKSIVK